MPIRERNLSPSLAAKIAQMGIFLSPNAHIIYVDSGHAATGTGKPGSNPRNPLSTINAAFTVADTAVTASNGDVVLVMPGHTENITNATDLAPDVVGVNIVGLGRGSDRPTLTFTATGSNIPISAANITMSNFLMTISGTIDVVVGITVSAADVLLRDIEMREAAIDDQFVDAIQGATCARLHVDGFKFVGATASDQATQSAINITDTSTEIEISRFNLLGSFTEGAIELAATTDTYIHHGRIEQRHTSRDECIRTATTTTGYIESVRLRTATDDTAGMDAISGDTDMQLYDIGIVNADAEMAAEGALTDQWRIDNTATTNSPFNASMV